MQILLSKTAHARIGPRLKAIAPEDVELILVTPDGQFERDGAPVPAESVDPDIAWLSIDAMRDGYMPIVLQRLAASTRTKWVQSFLAGLDNPAFKQIIAKGISLSKSSAQAVSIAEYITAHAFGRIVPIEAQREAQARKEWTRTPFREIGDTRWTMVGFGSIGYEVARRIKPYGVHLTVVRRDTDNRGLADSVITLAEIASALPQSDVVVLACSLNDETRHLANDAFFGAMKKNAILINIGRGALIEDAALKRGLDRDQPGCAVLDVFEKEPLPTDSWMWEHPKVHVSAHTSPNGSGTVGRGDELFLDNLRRYLAGEKVSNEATRAEVGFDPMRNVGTAYTLWPISNSVPS